MQKSIAAFMTTAVIASLAATTAAYADTPPRSPMDVAEATERYFNAGDIEGLASLYDDDSLFVTADGKEHRGVADIRRAFTGFLAKNSRISDEGHGEIFTAKETGLIIVNWRFTGRDGHPDSRGTGTDVARRRADGRWVYAIDNPYGVSRAVK